MQIHHHDIPNKEFAIDVLLFLGTISAIFAFGLAALPLVHTIP